tara:strand:+ start:8003 stop:8821 length:819 start_codon:yes stop_codon:yes gene_type:complete
MQRPKFSIISPTLEGFDYLERHLNSVRSQGLPAHEVEHWIIDGGSKDGSRAYLTAQRDIRFVSEPDRGLSHAVNKGIERATGDWIIWLNVDDQLAPNSLQSFLDHVKEDEASEIVCGAQEVRDYEGNTVEISPPWKYTASQLLKTRTAIIQASTFVHRSVYESVGGMDESYKFAMDYEWMVRASLQFKCRTIPSVLTIYNRRKGSITDVGTAKQHREFLRVRRKYKCSFLETMEWKLRFYLATEPLRKVRWFRRFVQLLKQYPSSACHATKA